MTLESSTQPTLPFRQTAVDLRRHYLNAGELLTIAPGSVKPRPNVARQRPKRLTEVEIEAIKSKYEAGSTQVDLATEFGVNRKTIMRHLGRLRAPLIGGQAGSSSGEALRK